MLYVLQFNILQFVVTSEMGILTIFSQGVFPTTADQCFELLFSDSSSFTKEYRSTRKDTDLTVSFKI